MYRVVKLFPLLLLTALFGCGTGGGGGSNSGAPVITSFSANPSSVAAGSSALLSWVITGSPTSLTLNGASVNGTNTTVTPAVTTTYTLTASNSSGSDDATTTVMIDSTGPVTPPPPGGNRTVSFGVSGSQAGPFQSDAGSNITSGDSRIVDVAAGDTFYAQLTYSGPSPVTGVTIYLANSSPAGFRSNLVQGTDVNGFTLNEAVGSCVTDGTQTSVTCTYPVDVAEGTPNITGLAGSGSEFAYVLRTRVTDTTGTVYDQPPRGYVTVGGSSVGTPTPTPTPTPNSAPTVSIGGEEDREVNTGVNISLVATGRDADDDTLEYQWSADPSSGVTFTAATSATTNVEFANADDYTVTVTVRDGEGGTGKDTVSFEVEDDDDNDDGASTAPTITSFSATPSTITADEGSTLEWAISGTATEVKITPGDGRNLVDDADKQISVMPSKTTTYTISAKNGSATAEMKTAEVTVNAPVFSVSIAEVDPVTLDSEEEATAALDGTVSNSPAGTTTYTWTAEGNNAGDVEFESPDAVDTNVTFGDDGTYILKLTATNGTQTPSGTVNVVVKPQDMTDTTAPTVTVDRASEQEDSTSAETISFSVVFSETVTGFANSDVSIAAGTAGATTVTVTGSGATYSVAVAGMMKDGTVVIDVAMGAAEDAAGNASTAPTNTDNSVNYTVPAP